MSQPLLPGPVPAEFNDLMKDSHGWVIPRPDGSKATCGGPGICRVCSLEQAVFMTRDRITVIEGLVLKPGDKVLLIGPPTMTPDDVRQMLEHLRMRFPEIEFTVVAGFTGIQVDKGEYRVQKG